MDRLSGLDASFLYLETPAQLMHVCGVIVLDPGTRPTPYTFDTFQAEIEAQVLELRIERHRGAVFLAGELGLVASTVGRILARRQLPALASIDPITGEPNGVPPMKIIM